MTFSIEKTKEIETSDGVSVESPEMKSLSESMRDEIILIL